MFFIFLRDVQDDNFGDKHFNFDVDGHNYYILRYVKILDSINSEGFAFFFTFLRPKFADNGVVGVCGAALAP